MIAVMCNSNIGSAGQDTAETTVDGLRHLQADKAAVEDRLGQLMAEMQAFKQQAAGAETKSRADRKVSLNLHIYWNHASAIILALAVEQSNNDFDERHAHFLC